MRVAFAVSLVLILAGCTRDATMRAAPASAQGATSCAPDLAAIHALRDGPQPCTTPADCTVWHNGSYWDGCPREVNTANGARLDAMRATYESHGCSVQTNGACAAFAVQGCVRGTCGGF